MPNATCGFGLRRDVELMGVLEDVLVTVRRRVEEHELVALLDPLAAERHVARGGAAHVLHRGAPPDHLLGGHGHVGRARAQRLPLIGVLDQLEHPAAEHVPGRLVTADEDQQHLLDDRLVIEALAVDLGLAQRRDHVVPGVLPPIRDDPELRLAELLDRAVRALQDLGDLLRGDHVVGRRAHDLLRPPQEIVVEIGLVAEELGDHEQRQPRGDVPDEVAAALLAHPVDDLRGTAAASSAGVRRHASA